MIINNIGTNSYCYESSHITDVFDRVFFKLFVFVIKKLMWRCQEAKSLPMGSMNLCDLYTAYLFLRRNSICLALDEIYRTCRHSFYWNRVKIECEKVPCCLFPILYLEIKTLKRKKPLTHFKLTYFNK